MSFYLCPNSRYRRAPVRCRRWSGPLLHSPCARDQDSLIEPLTNRTYCRLGAALVHDLSDLLDQMGLTVLFATKRTCESKRVLLGMAVMRNERDDTVLGHPISGEI